MMSPFVIMPSNCFSSRRETTGKLARWNSRMRSTTSCMVWEGILHISRKDSGHLNMSTFSALDLRNVRHAHDADKLAIFVEHRQGKDFAGKHDLLHRL